MAIRQAALLAIVVAPLMASAGCVFIPTPPHGGVGALPKAVRTSLKPGSTTRSDVVIAFGDPAERLQHDRFFVYRWNQVHGYFAAGAGYTGAVAPTTKDHYLVLEFADDHRLRRFRFIDPWLFQNSGRALKEWMEASE